MKIAVIDIGSNSIRYMEAEHTKEGFGFSDKSVFTTRLATGLINTGLLAEDRIAASIDVLQLLSDRAAQRRLPCYCYATSAVRDAQNRNSFLIRVKDKTGLHIDVLSGDEEARLARIGAGQDNGGLIDIGGGSSQVITKDYRRSFPLGCVRARDLCGNCSLQDMIQILTPVFNEIYRDLPTFSEMEWTAVGGTATTLAALSLGMTQYDAKRICQAELSQSTLFRLLQHLDNMGDTNRSMHPLLVKRHDVICCGGVILLHLMQRIGIMQIKFSDADGLEGYAIQYLSKSVTQ